MVNCTNLTKFAKVTVKIYADYTGWISSNALTNRGYCMIASSSLSSSSIIQLNHKSETLKCISVAWNMNF